MGTLFRLRTDGKYIYGWVILKTQRRKQTDDRTEKKAGEETREKCEELDGKGQVLLEGRGTIGCYKCGVGDCLCAKAYTCILTELCCKRVDWQPSFSSVSP